MSKFTHSRWTGLLCSLALVLILGIALLLYVATPASAAEVTASGTCGDALTWELTDDGVLTISGTGAMTDFTCPRYTTSATPPPWYVYQSSITSVVVNEGVTTIGAYAFDSCKSISRVSLPESLTAIGTYAFYGCTALYSIDIPDFVSSLGSYCFSGCTSLTSVSFPDNLTAIPNSCFYQCSALVSVDLPSSINSIGGSSFNGTGIVDITIPAGVTSVGYSAFYSKSLVSIHFLGTTPPSVSDSFASTRDCPLDLIYVPDGCVDAYASASGWTRYARYLVEDGYTGFFDVVNLSDYLASFDNTETELTRVFSIIDYVPPVSTSSYALSYIDGYTPDAYGQYSLRHFDSVFYIGDLVKNSYNWSLLASFTYTSSNSSPYSGSRTDLYVYFYDANGQFLSSVNVRSTSSIKPTSGTMTYSLSLLSKQFPSDAVYMAVRYDTPTFSGMNVSSFTADMDFTVRGEPVIPPVEPEVTDDFGGEVNYLRGQAASPLSVTATITDDGTLSYQWYYIDSENVNEAVAIPGATGAAYIPDTRTVGSRYYYCVVTNTLGEMTAMAHSDYLYVTVERPTLGDGYDIYDYKDYVTGTEVSGTNKIYYVTFPMQGFYTGEYGGYGSDRQLLDYFIGTEMYLTCPDTSSSDDNYYIRLDYYPLGMGSQPNLLDLSNIPVGMQAGFEMIVGNDSDQGSATMVFLWYDSDGYYFAKTEYTVTSAFNDDLQAWVYAMDFIYTPPSEAAYCAYYLSVDGLRPESNFDQDLTIRTAEFYLTISTLDDIQGSVDDVGDKVDQVGDKVDQVGDKIDQVGGEIMDGIGETNDKLDDLISGGEAGDELVEGSDKLDQSGEQLGGVVDDLHGAQDALPDLPDNIADVLVDNTALVVDSNVNGFMPWNDSEYGEFWNLLFTPTVAAVSVALLLYFVFGKARSTA